MGIFKILPDQQDRHHEKRDFSKSCEGQLDPILHAATIFWVVSTLEDFQHPPMGMFLLGKSRSAATTYIFGNSYIAERNFSCRSHMLL